MPSHEEPTLASASPFDRPLNRTWVALAFLTVFFSSSCFAALGGDVRSVIADQTYFHGSLQTAQTGSFVVHKIALPTGTEVREYASPAGTVFAVSWSGTWPPNLQQLLGSYFKRFAEALAHSPNRAGRRPFVVEQPDFVVRTSGHMRSYSGKVYLPEKLPAGVQAEAIQ